MGKVFYSSELTHFRQRVGRMGYACLWLSDWNNGKHEIIPLFLTPECVFVCCLSVLYMEPSDLFCVRPMVINVQTDFSSPFQSHLIFCKTILVKQMHTKTATAAEKGRERHSEQH